MRYLKIMGLAFAAVLALSAVSAAGASAAEEFSKAGATFKGKSSGETILEVTNGESVKCAAATGEGKIETKTTIKTKISFTKCTAFGGGAECTSTGAAKGEIKVELEGLLGSVEAGHDGLLLKKNPENGEIVSFVCSAGILGSATIKVRGSVICLLEPTNSKFELITPTLNTLSKFWELVCTQTKGVQAETKFEGETKVNTLESESVASGFGKSWPWTQSGQQSTAQLELSEEISVI